MAKRRRRRGALPAGLRNRGGKLYYYFRLKGFQHTGKTDLEDSAENYPQALLLRQQALERAKAGRLTSGSFGAVAREALKLRAVKDSTRGTYNATLSHLLAYFGERTPIRDITTADVEKYKYWRRENNISSATVRNGLIILRGIFQYAIKARLIAENPVDDVKKPKMTRRTRVITEGELERYLAYAWVKFPRLAAVATLMIEQGMRPGEIMDMTVENVVEGRYWIYRSKTDTGKRWVYLTPKSLEALGRVAPVTGLYFASKPDSNLPWSATGRAYCHNEVLKEVAPGDHWPLYSLRHTFATRGMEKGIHPLVLARIMGHSSPVVTEIYQHVSESEVAKAMMTLQDDTTGKDKPGQGGTNRDKGEGDELKLRSA